MLRKSIKIISLVQHVATAGQLDVLGLNPFPVSFKSIYGYIKVTLVVSTVFSNAFGEKPIVQFY